MRSLLAGVLVLVLARLGGLGFARRVRLLTLVVLAHGFAHVVHVRSRSSGVHDCNLYPRIADPRRAAPSRSSVGEAVANESRSVSGRPGPA
jgi:hypothetical protein